MEEENKPEVPEPQAESKAESKRAFTLESIFDSLYLLIFAVLIVYTGYVFYAWADYSEDDFIQISYYYIPIFFFSIFGIMSVRRPRSLVIAIVAAIVSFVLLVFFYQAIWPML
jgi:hypothetical protein